MIANIFIGLLIVIIVGLSLKKTIKDLKNNKCSCGSCNSCSSSNFCENSIITDLSEISVNYKK